MQLIGRKKSFIPDSKNFPAVYFGAGQITFSFADVRKTYIAQES